MIAMRLFSRNLALIDVKIILNITPITAEPKNKWRMWKISNLYRRTVHSVDSFNLLAPELFFVNFSTPCI